ncbi:MAG: hypothetical protein WBG86_03655, partial [Polyangiales bacterium]
MRILLVVVFLLAACGEKKEERVSAAPTNEGRVAVEAGARVKVSETPPSIIDRDGWMGPSNAMSGAWKHQLQNCLEVQTALPRELYEKIPSNDRDDLDRLHAQILTQWDRDKSPE